MSESCALLVDGLVRSDAVTTMGMSKLLCFRCVLVCEEFIAWTKVTNNLNFVVVASGDQPSCL